VRLSIAPEKSATYDPRRFWTNLIWNTRGQPQCFQSQPAGQSDDICWEDRQSIPECTVGDHRRVAVPLDFGRIRTFARYPPTAAALQKIESEAYYGDPCVAYAKRGAYLTMAEFIEGPMEPVSQSILDESRQVQKLAFVRVPKMADLTGSWAIHCKNLFQKNQGLHPYLMGDFPVETVAMSAAQETGAKPLFGAITI